MLNKLISDIEYPLLETRDMLDQLGSVAGKEAIFTSLDIIWGYFRLGVPKEERDYLSFKWRGAHYRFTCARFGVKIMAGLFQMVMDKILAYVPFALAYIDDIIIFSRNKEEHIRHVNFVIDLLTKFNLPIKLGKSRFGQRKVKLLGFIVSGSGIEMDPEKVKSILDWPIPKTVKGIERFLGTANFYRQFVKNFSMISASLDSLRKRKGNIEWTIERKRAFNKIKEEISNGLMLRYPDESKPFLIWTDASKTGLGAWIAQKQDGKICTLCFPSLALSGTERNYSATKRELLGILWSLEKFLSYVFGRKFTLYTDHHALRFLFSQSHTNHMTMDHFLRDKKQPESEERKRELIEQAHSFGHFGSQEVFRKLWNDGWWWPKMRDEILTELSSCMPCLRYNVQKEGTIQ